MQIYDKEGQNKEIQHAFNILTLTDYRHIVCVVLIVVMKWVLNRKIHSGNQLGNSEHCSRPASNIKHFGKDQNLENFAWLPQWGHMALTNSFSMSNES